MAPGIVAPRAWSLARAAHSAGDATTPTGPFADLRHQLDYTWHTHYSASRQALQDGIVTSFLRGGCMAERPWLVFTAGPMGAGKTYTLRHLAATDLFPVNSFVLIDPDRIRSCLPEHRHHLAQNPVAAGALTHREAGFIAELIERVALARSLNVLIDGSLRNASWYAAAWQRIRAEHPSYRIAILLVTASPQRVYERADRRAARTGRHVPRQVLDEAIAAVPRSFATLAPLADFTAVIDNDDAGSGGTAPRLLPPVTPEAFRAVWSRVCDDAMHRNEHGPDGVPLAGSTGLRWQHHGDGEVAMVPQRFDTMDSGGSAEGMQPSHAKWPRSLLLQTLTRAPVHTTHRRSSGGAGTGATPTRAISDEEDPPPASSRVDAGSGGSEPTRYGATDSSVHMPGDHDVEAAVPSPPSDGGAAGGDAEVGGGKR